MYLFKQAWLSITRNKGRNILIGLIIVVISVAATITLSIVNSADKIVSSYEEKYDVEASISMDRTNLMESLKDGDSTQEEMINKFNDIESITVEEIDLYGDSEYVKEYYYVYSVSVNAKDITEATDSLVKETTEVKTEIQSFGGGGNGGDKDGFPGGDMGGTRKQTTTTKTEEIKNMKAANGAYTLLGYSSYSSMTDFISGNYTVTSGTIFEDFESNSCVISEELASLNDLSVGDTITLVSPNSTKITYEVVITGIYKENTDDADNMNNMFTSSANTIIVSSNTVNAILELDTDLVPTITPTFVLNSKDVVEAFAAEVKEKGLSDYYTVTDNLDTVNSATESIKNVKVFAITFLVITIIIGVVVLFVINMINIRERRYEIGVLRTIGMKKSRVIIKFLIELLLVACVSLLIGAAIGSVTSVDVANSLLANEIENSETNEQAINDNFGSGHDRIDFKNTSGSVNVEKIDEIEAIVDFKVVGELLIIGILITIVSSTSSCIAIARFSPLTILKERS